jgi:hypothetical protein
MIESIFLGYALLTDRRKFSTQFLSYRFEYAALVWDCVAVCGDNTYRWHSRLLALIFVPLLLALPAAILLVGAEPFGDAYAFGAAFILWPFFLEVPGRRLRQAAINGDRHIQDPTQFDFFLFWAFTLAAVAAQLYLLFFADTASLTEVELGTLWGVALAGGLDCARSAIASGLAASKGYPLYGERPLR